MNIMSQHDSNSGTFNFNSFSIMFTTLFSTYLVDKLKLNTMYYGILHSLLLQIMLFFATLNLDLLNQFNFNYNFINWYLVYIFIFLGLCAGFYYLMKKNTQYIKITMYSYDQVNYFRKYLEYNGEYYQSEINMNIGDLDKLYEASLLPRDDILLNDLIKESKAISEESNTKINFDDKYLNIKGYYQWKSDKKQTQITDKNNKNNILTKDNVFKYVEFYILKEKKKIDVRALINKIKNFVDSKNKNEINLKYIKILKDRHGGYNHVVSFYKGIRQNLCDLETKYIKTFFHPERDRLWTIVKNITLHPEQYTEKGQGGKLSLLLYGPPGTGKSSFAYRLAMCTLRNIISLDLRDFSKVQTYQIMQKPSESLCSSYKDAVFLFEEFDISIKELEMREKKKKIDEANYLNCIENFVERASSVVDKTEKKEQEIVTPSDFSIRDLLEIFQGPLPFEGMIIIASTNKYDEIKNICPELFRPGRLTPVYFGYIDKVTLQDISKFYFGKKLSIYIPDQITIPSSQIIDLALESLSNGKIAFNYFQDKLNLLFKQC